jgi:hypothetical protein
VFSKKKYKTNVVFKIYGQAIDLQDSYSYLGVIFNYNGHFCTARNKLLDQANKALYALCRKIRNLAIPIDLQLKLFDSLITPILVYSCEVWGFENKQGIEKMHLQYCKRNLNLRSSTPNVMVYGEIGRFPVEIIIKLRMATFSNKMLCNNNKLSSIMYRLMFKLHQSNPIHFKWITYVKSIVDECGLSFIWNDQIHMNRNALKYVLKQKFKLEPYLIRLHPSDRIDMCKLRCSNLKLPIETGRWALKYVIPHK